MSYHYDSPSAANTFGFGVNDVEAFAAEYAWDGSEEGLTAAIPERYEGMGVTAIGGFYGRGVPCPFRASIPDSLKTIQGDYFITSSPFEGDTYENLVFHFAMSKNVREVRNAQPCYYLGVTVDNADDILYKVSYDWTVEKGNSTFYAEEGKLYYQSDHSLVSTLSEKE